MKKTTWLGLALGAMFCGMTTSAQATPIPVYTVGSTYYGDKSSTKEDTVGAYYESNMITYYQKGYSTVNVSITADFTGWATLSIVAEGIDAGEDDTVYFGTAGSAQYLGTLTQQGTYSNSFYINRNAGALAGKTALTTTDFTVNVTANQTYTLSIVIDPDVNWVNEIETVSLTPVPEPTTMLLFGTGLVGLMAVARKKRN